jgi:phage tail sheath protein FI
VPKYVAPGTYVEETSFRQHPISGASTSRTGFVGTAGAGPVGVASKALTTFADYSHIYGGAGDLASAARGFFENGGEHLHVVRITEIDGDAEPSIAAYASALDVLAAVDDISIIAAPGSSGLASTTAHAVAQALVDQAEVPGAHCFAVLDAPRGATIAEIRAYRAQFDSQYAALYYPWLAVPGAGPGETTVVPPSGHVCGIYARVDNERGVHKAPVNEVVRGIIGFERAINKADQDLLNPEGINCFRNFEGRGLRLWGARTVSSDPEWKYVSVRRYITYLNQSIYRGLQWAVFEPNGESLWVLVRQTVENFLYREWTSGALQGQRPDSAFFVRCDQTTMTQNDVSNGRLVCQIGVAMLRPAEFTIFSVSGKTADASV